MRTLLLGANGLLGSDLLIALQQHGRIEVIPATRSGQLADNSIAERIELANETDVNALLDRVQPDLIINAAAYTAVDQAEREESMAMRVNCDVPATLGRWAAKRQTLVVHYSTDYVFDGEQTRPYTPLSKPSPLGAYGRSKLAGEQALQASGAAHLILRTAWLYGRHGNNFLLTMLKLADAQAVLRVVNDQHGTPTGTRRVAASTLAAMDRWLAAGPEQRLPLQGVHHLVASGATTWHGYATMVVEHATNAGLLNRRPLIEAVGSNAFPTPARRPHHAVLDNSSFVQTFGADLPSWQDDVAAFIRQLGDANRHAPCPA